MAIVYMNTWQHTGQIHAISFSWTRFFLFVLLQLLLIHRFRLSIVLINDCIPSYFHSSTYINKYTIHEHLADRRCDWAWKLQNWHDLKFLLIKTYKNVFWQWAIIRFMDEWSIWLGRITIYNCKSQCLLAAHWSDSWTRFFLSNLLSCFYLACLNEMYTWTPGSTQDRFMLLACHEHATSLSWTHFFFPICYTTLDSYLH